MIFMQVGQMDTTFWNETTGEPRVWNLTRAVRGKAGGKGPRHRYLACCLSYYALSYRDLEEMMLERGLPVDHTTIYRWVQRYAPELEKRCRPHLKPTTDSWRVDETYVKVKGVWMYLYRAVDSQGNTLEFWLSATRDTQAAKRFFTKALRACHTVAPRVITVDKNAAYPKALHELKAVGLFQLLVNCDRANISTTWSNKITALSNDWSNQGWVSSPLRRRGTHYKDMKS
jgi:transposase-like protein